MITVFVSYEYDLKPIKLWIFSTIYGMEKMAGAGAVIYNRLEPELPKINRLLNSDKPFPKS
jgi:hypothetical protein